MAVAELVGIFGEVDTSVSEKVGQSFVVIDHVFGDVFKHPEDFGAFKVVYHNAANTDFDLEEIFKGTLLLSFLWKLD